jgi:hypothetical protein
MPCDTLGCLTAFIACFFTASHCFASRPYINGPTSYDGDVFNDDHPHAYADTKQLRFAIIAWLQMAKMCTWQQETAKTT